MPNNLNDRDDVLLADDGFFYGIGIFETINVVNGCPILLEKHARRMAEAILFFNIKNKIIEKEAAKTGLESCLKDLIIQKINAACDSCKNSNISLKFVVTDKNIKFYISKNPYEEEKFNKGADLCISKVLRNETSEFTKRKTLNYGDNIVEKRLAKSNGFDEALFLNSKKEVCEGAVSNIFFVRDEKIYTPHESCGLLKGTVRAFILEKLSKDFLLEERVIKKEEITSFEEAFITNSLMGVMPVRSIEAFQFGKRDICDTIRKAYLENVGCIF